MNEAKNLPDLRQHLSTLDAAAGLRYLAEAFPGGVTFSSSLGKEDQVITHLIAAENLPIHIFSLDTGRLFPETLDLLARTTARYSSPIEVIYPPQEPLERWVRTNGINGFYESIEKRKGCCALRKVEGLKRGLAGKQVWITGLRAEQSENRASMPLLEWDSNFHLFKYNPLLHWTDADVDAFIEKEAVPYNPLHDKGYPSIGCAPCTRAIQPGEDSRAGRWWWESSHKECGLHVK
ncbi:adenylylsulfate reductase [Nitritalea halalkaliphila LW7]|uniref:Adenosine 5'-phosphosulfate reductase n=1 Tax=Nitritalea halalkaliphila LW7 TaxID=1189621 RepID=I5C180_9BACT|nr:phosphoadenylyl-sulfate reductase [Nitritalea halalkaliphila]EIM75582.1 adenylylsulfate reductase [Nitritalea halalkaliphila LW7]